MQIQNLNYFSNYFRTQTMTEKKKERSSKVTLCILQRRARDETTQKVQPPLTLPPSLGSVTRPTTSSGEEPLVASAVHARVDLDFEWVFRNWFGFLYDTAEEWLDQAANSPVELGEAVPDRRETDKALYMSLAMVCKNEALDVVKTVTHKRGFESWRKLSKEYGATAGTSLHEYTNLLEYDFGTTDGFKKRLLKCENQIVDFQKATGEVFSDRLKCAIVLSRSPAPIRTTCEFRIEEITELFELH